MPELKLHLPVASPHAYLAWVAWWRDVEGLMGVDSLAPSVASPRGDAASRLAGESVILEHLSLIEADARRAIREGEDEIAPELVAESAQWSDWLEYARTRSEWLDALAFKGLRAPEFPADLVALWQETLRTISATVSDHATWHDLRTVQLGEPGHFRLEGELEIANVEAVADLLEAEMGAGHQLVLDVASISFIDSKGLELLVRLAGVARRAGLDPVVLIAPSDSIRKVLEIAIPDGIEGVEMR
ncbi:MAG: hypothetical protein DMF81_18725 [Acidobacteria bacterium]|nr:MAG: hypothetical protein DMF81_18725 [Acidobacteriota bacterium]